MIASQERFFVFPGSELDKKRNHVKRTFKFKKKPSAEEPEPIEEESESLIKNAILLHEFADGSVLVSTLIGPEEVREFRKKSGYDDILTLEAVTALGLIDCYIGETLEDVFLKYPELEGQELLGQDDDGNDIVKNIIPVARWTLGIK